MTTACKIDVLIPELSEQVPSCFWREIEVLPMHCGIGWQTISPCLAPRPVMHDRIAKADAKQLYPMLPGYMAAPALALVASQSQLRPSLGTAISCASPSSRALFLWP